MSKEKVKFQKMVLLLVGFFYPLWGVFFKLLLPGSYDPIVLRLIGAFLILGVLALFQLRVLRSSALLGDLFLLLFCGIELHAFYLVKLNPESSLFRIQCLTAVAGLAFMLTSQKQILLFILWIAALSMWLFLSPIDLHAFLVFSMFNATILTIIWFSRPSRIWSLKALESRTEEVKKLYEQQSHFIGALSHDLRTPLVPLFAILPKLLDSAPDEKTKKMLKLSIRNVAYLKGLVEHSLNYAYLSSGVSKIQARPFEIRELASDVFGLLESQASGKVELLNEVESGFFAVADRQKIQEVLVNLVSNAIRHTPSGGVIRIAAESQEGRVTVSVTDSGVGMTPEQLEKAFTAYYRGDSSRHERGSAGLGLSICKSILVMHGEKIWAESPGLNCGTKLIFTLKGGGIEPAFASGGVGR
ncbi:MAG: sensor histidine kinase [Bdellovibrionota bacterium]